MTDPDCDCFPVANSEQSGFRCIVIQYKDILIPLSLYIFRKRLLRSVLFKTCKTSYEICIMYYHKTHKHLRLFSDDEAIL